MPIILEQLTMPSDLAQLSNNDFIKSWNLLNLRNDYMPIISPIFPEQNTAFNTNEFTRDIIVKEMKKGTVYPLITTLGNYCFDLSLEGVINRGRVIIRGLKFKRVLGVIMRGNYCFNRSLVGIINGSGVII